MDRPVTQGCSPSRLNSPASMTVCHSEFVTLFSPDRLAWPSDGKEGLTSRRSLEDPRRETLTGFWSLKKGRSSSSVKVEPWSSGFIGRDDRSGPAAQNEVEQFDHAGLAGPLRVSVSEEALVRSATKMFNPGLNSRALNVLRELDRLRSIGSLLNEQPVFIAHGTKCKKSIQGQDKPRVRQVVLIANLLAPNLD